MKQPSLNIVDLERFHVGIAKVGYHQIVGVGLHTSDRYADGCLNSPNESGIQEAFHKQHQICRELASAWWRGFGELKQDIDFELGKAIVGESQVGLVHPKRLPVDLSLVNPSVTIRAESNQVLVEMFSARLPRDDVMDIDVDVSASRYRTPVPCFDKHLTSEVARDARTYITHLFMTPTNQQEFLTCMT